MTALSSQPFKKSSKSSKKSAHVNRNKKSSKVGGDGLPTPKSKDSNITTTNGTKSDKSKFKPTKLNDTPKVQKASKKKKAGLPTPPVNGHGSLSMVGPSDDEDDDDELLLLNKVSDKDLLPHHVLSLSKVSGGQLSAFPAVFSADNNYFILPTSNSMKLFSLSGSLVRTISPPDAAGSHSATITSVSRHLTNKFQLFSASLDGCLKLWDINDGGLLKTWNVRTPISNFKIHPKEHHIIYISTTKTSFSPGGSKPKLNSIIYRYNLKTNCMKRLLKTRYASGMDISSNGDWIVVTAKSKLHVGHIHRPEKGKKEDSAEVSWRWFESDTRLETVVCHPIEPSVATADEKGVIKLWRCLEKSSDVSKEGDVKLSPAPVTTIHHWHSSSLSSLAFTPSGEYLLSGGAESVLVVWQLQTGYKQFIPRLGSEILSVSVSGDGGLFCVGMVDNGVRIVSAEGMRVRGGVIGVKFGNTIESGATVLDKDHSATLPFTFGAGLLAHPKTGHVVLNGSPGTLQFYNAVNDSHVTELEIIPRNHLPSTDAVNPPSLPTITHASFSLNGTYLATISVIHHTSTHKTTTLHIFKLNKNMGKFELNVKADNPHGSGDISSIRFGRYPSESDELADDESCVLVTCGLTDRRFRLWTPTEVTERRRVVSPMNSVSNTWESIGVIKFRCKSTGYFRDLIPSDSSVSHDGSLLCVAFGKLLTIWTPSKLALLRMIPLPILAPQASIPQDFVLSSRVNFCASSPYVIVHTCDTLSVVNLLTCTVWWSLNFNSTKKGKFCGKIKCLSVCSERDEFAVVLADRNTNRSLEETHILIFQSISPSPILVHSVPENIQSLTYLPSTITSSERSAKEYVGAEDDQLLLSSDFVYYTQSNNLKILSPRSANIGVEVNPLVDTRQDSTQESSTSVENRLFSSIFRRDVVSTGSFGISTKLPYSAKTERVSSSTDKIKVHKNLAILYETPAHVLPSISGGLYDAIMANFLQPKMATEEIMHDASVANMDDVDMADSNVATGSENNVGDFQFMNDIFSRISL
ncbi:quinon protein alcohol dehydrogenase-like superfamily [Paraphysoderma sedebokerense]|nr:quinon protein alcohol dehydrogenase-like superfamily [Paraphysoderma sedebokerense]